jgi:hypothetical protein
MKKISFLAVIIFTAHVYAMESSENIKNTYEYEINTFNKFVDTHKKNSDLIKENIDLLKTLIYHADRKLTILLKSLKHVEKIDLDSSENKAVTSLSKVNEEVLDFIKKFDEIFEDIPRPYLVDYKETIYQYWLSSVYEKYDPCSSLKDNLDILSNKYKNYSNSYEIIKKISETQQIFEKLQPTQTQSFFPKDRKNDCNASRHIKENFLHSKRFDLFSSIAMLLVDQHMKNKSSFTQLMKELGSLRSNCAHEKECITPCIFCDFGKIAQNSKNEERVSAMKNWDIFITKQLTINKNSVNTAINNTQVISLSEDNFIINTCNVVDYKNDANGYFLLGNKRNLFYFHKNGGILGNENSEKVFRGLLELNIKESDILKGIGQLVFALNKSTTFLRGQAAISEWIAKGIAYYHGYNIDFLEWIEKTGISMDMHAMSCFSEEEFIKQFIDNIKLSKRCCG